MTSTSRKAQQALSEFEKSAATYDDQLVEACTFIGITTGAISSHEDADVGSIYSKKRKGTTASHGKEEWLLKWLLKKLQDKKDDVPRMTAGSWNLLRILLKRLSLSTAAKILVERKFIAIVQTTLEDAKERAVEVTQAPTINGDAAEKKSKKRKRTEENQGQMASFKTGTGELLRAILSAVDFIVRSTKAGSITTDEARGTEFAAEYMRAVLRVGAEDAAKILGNWLSLLKKHELIATNDQQQWISAFVEIWQLHAADENYLTHFSIHCTLPLLSLRAFLPAESTRSAELEQLVARNIILPAKAAKVANAESTLLADLTKLAVISDSHNATYLFDIAIRSIQPQLSRRRSTVDEAWLKTVCSTLLAAMPRKRIEQNGKALCAMIRSSIAHKVILDLEVLRSITQEFVLGTSYEYQWELLELIIKLDPNVFLIPVEDGQESLLQQLFGKVANAPASEKWKSVEPKVVNDVLVPLMQAFAQARDLVGFIHHWHFQIHKAVVTSKSSSPCAWEDSRLLEALKPLLETSLSVQQVTQLLVWLSEQDTSHGEATTVISQALSAAISSEEYVDAVGTKCYHVIFGKETNIGSETKYYWRTLRTITNTISFGSATIKNEVSELWASHAMPFKNFPTHTAEDDDKLGLDSDTKLELWKLVCTAWSSAREGSKLQEVSKQLVLLMISSLPSDVARLQSACHSFRDVRIQMDLVVLKIRYLLVNTPQIFRLATVLGQEDFKGLIENMYCVAASLIVISESSATPSPILHEPWLSVLKEDCILNVPEVIDVMIDVMLDAVNRDSCSEHGGDLAMKAFLQLPIAVLHRRHRERLMTSWQSSPSSILSSSVLALKIKVMRFPMFYEGMVFQHLAMYAKSISNTSPSKQLTQIALLKQLAKMTIEFVLSNIDQSRNQTYIADAFATASKEAKRMAEKEEHSSDIGLIGLCEVVIQTLHAQSKAMLDANVIKEKDLKKSASRLEAGLLRVLQANTTVDNRNDLLAIVTLDALSALDVQTATIEVVRQSVDTQSGNAQHITQVVRDRASLFLASHSEANIRQHVGVSNCVTVLGRKAVATRAASLSRTASSAQKMELLRLSLEDPSGGLTQLLAARHVILASDDIRKKQQTKDSDSDSSDLEPEVEIFDLSQAYSLLCTHLRHSTSTRQFLLIIETLTTMLRTKPRSITQWNVDSTLGAISQICSRNGPSLRSSRASTIYLHLCHLFQAILLSHRLKLEGHFHLVVQALQSLLRCLFIPLPHSSNKILKQYTSPPWLSTSAQAYPLTPIHASVFTRLLTLICDPSVSSVTHHSHHKSKTPSLTSQTEKAKRMAGQHMVFVLMSYVKMTLELRMGAGMREKMTPGLYAVFETTTVEGRRAVSEALDASGRAVFGGLYRDWVRWGKWKGS